MKVHVLTVREICDAMEGVSVKDINKELVGTGYQIKLNDDAKGTDRYVHLENEQGEFLDYAPSIVKALIEIGYRSRVLMG